MKADVGQLTTDVGQLKMDVMAMKADVGQLKISSTVLGTQMANLIMDVSEVRRNSNKWLYYIVGIYILKEGYDRYDGYDNHKRDTPSLTLATPPPSLNIFHDRRDRPPVPEGKVKKERPILFFFFCPFFFFFFPVYSFFLFFPVYTLAGIYIVKEGYN